MLALAVLLWPRQDTTDPPPVLDPAVGRGIVVPVNGGHARFRLRSHSAGQLVLVVASLGDPGSHHPVTLQRWTAPPTNATAPRFSSSSSSPIHTRPIRTYWSAPSPPAPVVSLVNSPVTRVGAQEITRPFDIPLLSQTTPGRNDHARIRARAIARGQRVRIFLDEAEPLTPRLHRLASTIIGLLETALMPAADRTFGPPVDIDQDGYLTVLLTPWLGRLQRGKTTVGGFVRIDDFRTDLARPDSNRADLMYLNTSLVPGPHLANVVSHEYTHVLACSARAPSRHNPSGLPMEDDWLNEAIAHLSEPGTSNISHRVACFLESPGKHPLVVPDYYKAGLWRSDGCRGATYLFLRWCRQEHGQGLTARLVQSPWWGIRNVEAATGQQFSGLFRDWCLALVSLPRSPDARGLQRPQLEDWTLDRPLALTLAGTSARYLRPLYSGDIIIDVTAAPDSRLQLTLAYIPRAVGPNTSASGRRASAAERSSTISQPYYRR